MLQRGADQVRISLRDVVLDVTEFRGRKRDGAIGSGQWSRVGSRGGNVADAAGLNTINHLEVRWVEEHVVSHVAKIALVADAVPAAEGGFAVAEHVPSEADARSEIMPTRLPQLADRTVGSGVDLAIFDADKLTGTIVTGSAAGGIEVGVETRIDVMLHSKIFPAEAEVQCQALGDLPGVLKVSRGLMITIAAFKVRGTHR